MVADCPRCHGTHQVLAHPRKVRNAPDRARCQESGLQFGDGDVVWVPRLWCACQWRAHLRTVDTDLLTLLLPDIDAQREIRRRATTGRAK